MTLLARVTGIVCLATSTLGAQPRHVVIDTDVGPDDLMAIAFLLGRPDVRIDAITTVAGLTGPTAGAQNVLRLLHLAHADTIPVHVGASGHLQATKPFPEAWVTSSEHQGAAAAPPSPRHPAAEPAAGLLARVLTSGGTTQILALGPLTNIAQAVRKAGPLRVQPHRLVVMGGALDAPGNLVTPEFHTANTRAEWNVYSDPLAAREVVASPLRMELIALDATRHVKMDSCFLRFVESGDRTPLRAYVGRILEGSRQWIARGDYYAWDPLAAVALVDRGVVTLSRVGLAVDVAAPFDGWTHRSSQGHEVAVAVGASRARFLQLFDAALGPRHEGGVPACPSSPDRR